LGAPFSATRIESITASNAIEGVTVDPGRVAGLVTPSGDERRYRNRNEREFAGYRDAIDEIATATEQEVISVPYVLHLHRLLFGHVDGDGGRLKTDQNLIVSYEGGQRRVLFTPPSPKETEPLLCDLFERYRDAARAEAAHPVLLIGALVLDFLSIHPVADGNGRLARLLTTHALLAQGYEVSRYVSVEQRIFETKSAYYDALHASQRAWHEGDHDVWPWIDYLVGVLSAAYDDFETKVAARRSLQTGSKQEQVRRYILEHAPATFRLAGIRLALKAASSMSKAPLGERLPGCERRPDRRSTPVCGVRRRRWAASVPASVLVGRAVPASRRLLTALAGFFVLDQDPDVPVVPHRHPTPEDLLVGGDHRLTVGRVDLE
jgi:Fic family protein